MYQPRLWLHMPICNEITEPRTCLGGQNSTPEVLDFLFYFFLVGRICLIAAITCCLWLYIANVKHARTRDKKMWQQSESSKENPASFSPDFKAALQRDEISTGEPRPSNDIHRMGCKLIHYSLPPTNRICNSLKQV